MTATSQTERAKARAIWPIHVYKLGKEPSEDLSASTTADERLAMMGPLALEAWKLSGQPLPTYTRETMPVSTRKLKE
jgi:hypothetical protein